MNPSDCLPSSTNNSDRRLETVSRDQCGSAQASPAFWKCRSHSNSGLKCILHLSQPGQISLQEDITGPLLTWCMVTLIFSHICVCNKCFKTKKTTNENCPRASDFWEIQKFAEQFLLCHTQGNSSSVSEKISNDFLVSEGLINVLILASKQTGKHIADSTIHYIKLLALRYSCNLTR